MPLPPSTTSLASLLPSLSVPFHGHPFFGCFSYFLFNLFAVEGKFVQSSVLPSLHNGNSTSSNSNNITSSPPLLRSHSHSGSYSPFSLPNSPSSSSLSSSLAEDTFTTQFLLTYRYVSQRRGKRGRRRAGSKDNQTRWQEIGSEEIHGLFLSLFF